FSVIENLCSLGRTSTGAERIDIREHQRADLTPNARVCLHAEPVTLSSAFFVFACDRPASEYSMKGKEHGRICKIFN
ncbi:hypothetical protein ABEP22_10255, partial [Bacillus safensis]